MSDLNTIYSWFKKEECVKLPQDLIDPLFQQFAIISRVRRHTVSN